MAVFRWQHFAGEIILWAVRWYCRYGKSSSPLSILLDQPSIMDDLVLPSISRSSCARGIALVLDIPLMHTAQLQSDALHKAAHAPCHDPHCVETHWPQPLDTHTHD